MGFNYNFREALGRLYNESATEIEAEMPKLVEDYQKGMYDETGLLVRGSGLLDKQVIYACAKVFEEYHKKLMAYLDQNI